MFGFREKPKIIIYNINTNQKEIEKLMGILTDNVLAKLDALQASNDELKAIVVSADEGVEVLADQLQSLNELVVSLQAQIAALTNDGISQEASDQITAKLDAIQATVADTKASADKILTND